MFDEKYKVEFSYRSLTYKNVQDMLRIIDDSDAFEIYEIASSRMIKKNRVKYSEKKEFKDSKSFLNYLNLDIKYLDNLRFVFVDKEGNKVFLEYNEIFNKWKLTYDIENMQTNGLLLKLKSIFKTSLFSLYKQWESFIILFLCILYLSCMLLKYSYTILFSLIILFAFFEALAHIFKSKPYHNYKFIDRNRDSIILGIIFYILGVITPSLFSAIKSFLNI